MEPELHTTCECCGEKHQLEQRSFSSEFKEGEYDLVCGECWAQVVSIQEDEYINNNKHKL